MFVEIQISNYAKQNVEIDNSCPNCRKPIIPDVVSKGSSEKSVGKSKIFITLQCPGCEHFWVEEFSAILEGTNHYNLKHVEVKPELPSDIPMPEDIGIISPIGKDIYLQALKAENEKLDHIAGIGYRKALEFFVKDFVILTNMDEKSKVERMLLKQVIDEYIDDEELKTVALASTYIGNDEGHYFRKNPDKDISDLKNYLHGFIFYLGKKLTFLDAQELVSRSKKS